MPYISVGKENSADAELYYQDYGSSKPVVLIHGYPLSGASASLACVPTWLEDFRQDLVRVDVPAFVVRGDDDRIVPLSAAGQRTAKPVTGAGLYVVKGGPHWITRSHADEVNTELLGFLGENVANVRRGAKGPCAAADRIPLGGFRWRSVTNAFGRALRTRRRGMKRCSCSTSRLKNNARSPIPKHEDDINSVYEPMPWASGCAMFGYHK